MTEQQAKAMESLMDEKYPVICIVDILGDEGPEEQHIIVNAGPGITVPPQKMPGRDDEDAANRAGIIAVDMISPSGHGHPDVTIKWVAIEKDGEVIR